MGKKAVERQLFVVWWFGGLVMKTKQLERRFFLKFAPRPTSRTDLELIDKGQSRGGPNRAVA